MNAPFQARAGLRDPFTAFVCDDATADMLRPVAVEHGWSPEKVNKGGLRNAVQSLSVSASPNILFVDLSESADPLNDKDVKMSVLYDINKRTLAMGGRGALMDDQQQWLRDRRTCSANRACLNRSYDRRLGELERSMERIYRNGPF